MLQSKDTSLKPRHELGDKFTLLFEGGKSWPPPPFTTKVKRLKSKRLQI
ncbi:hypothetical protein ACKVMY_19750 [Vibrio natriegens]